MAGQVLPALNNYAGTFATTSAGAADGSTLVSTAGGKADGYYVGMTTMILASTEPNLVGVQREIFGYTSATGTFLVDPPYDYQVPDETIFAVLINRPTAGIAVIISDIEVPTPDSTANVYERDVVGNKTDAAVLVVGTTKSIVAYVKGILTYLLVPTADVATNTAARDVIGNKADVAVGTASVTASIVAYLKGALAFFLVPTADVVTNTSVRDVVGNKTDAAVAAVSNTASLVAYIKGILNIVSATVSVTATDGSVGPSDFFAGAITVLTLGPSAADLVSGFYLDCNGFTNGALLTATVTLKVGAGNAQRSFTNNFTKNATNTLFPIIDSAIPIKGVAASFVVTLQSDNALDTAITVPFTYFN